MSVASSTSTSPGVFDLKSATLSLVALVLKSCDLAELSAELDARYGASPQLFDDDPLVIDLRGVADSSDPVDFPALITLLRSHKLLPVAVQGGHAVQREAARAAGLAELSEDGAPAHQRAVEVPVAEAHTPALIVDRPLRSGQQVYARGSDLVVLGAVNFGAEVIADGSIHVYAPLRGRAVAGARGQTGARIFSTHMEPQLVSIAGIYRTSETELPADVLGRPAQVRLEGEKLVIEPIKL